MNLIDVTTQMGQFGQRISDSIQPLLASGEDVVNNPERMLQLQFAVQQYSAYINVESGMLKTVKDIISTIANRSF
ncbi:type III secretion system needle filament subunit SctF [Edwardsiella anguillarum]|uniref:type III secretion system needle filament subunit SctF n=1 Tax=Edwardsiella TaxID=635 RepID=UPI00045CE3F1|nr:type III secretion system needle filament subunit SctF [Edwardsiella anguillarum]AJK93304.1 SsaG [Edwardsiella sp. EA181011]GAJ68489.1 protein EscF [Edwardsiella piscicida]AKM46741.1 type III secretory protein EscF [Edwardsiella sp. EA181011]RFT03416.1 EscF/YscF/HrpA family type III secretion system needle major subunit [Edwardsiella anguillarum]WHQ14438.1 type III secretion system needle filament subunit SctF [Edwardsiella anguillarum]